MIPRVQTPVYFSLRVRPELSQSRSGVRLRALFSFELSLRPIPAARYARYSSDSHSGLRRAAVHAANELT